MLHKKPSWPYWAILSLAIKLSDAGELDAAQKAFRVAEKHRDKDIDNTHLCDCDASDDCDCVLDTGVGVGHVPGGICHNSTNVEVFLNG